MWLHPFHHIQKRLRNRCVLRNFSLSTVQDANLRHLSFLFRLSFECRNQWLLTLPYKLRQARWCMFRFLRVFNSLFTRNMVSQSPSILTFCSLICCSLLSVTALKLSDVWYSWLPINALPWCIYSCGFSTIRRFGNTGIHYHNFAVSIWSCRAVQTTYHLLKCFAIGSIPLEYPSTNEHPVGIEYYPECYK